MLNGSGGVIARHGRWRESFQALNFGGLDPSLFSFRLEMRPAGGCGRLDYGRRTLRGAGLQAASDDYTGRLVAQANDRGAIVTWSFPEAEVQALAPGSYEGALTAARLSDPTDVTLISSLVRVIR